MSKKMRAYILNFLAITAIFLVINLMVDAKLLSRSNRSMLMDVGIDTAGFLCGVVVIWAFVRLRRKKIK